MGCTSLELSGSQRVNNAHSYCVMIFEGPRFFSDKLLEGQWCGSERLDENFISDLEIWCRASSGISGTLISTFGLRLSGVRVLGEVR